MIVASLISSSVITARRCWLKRQKFDKKLAPSFTPHGKNPANSSTTSKQITKKTIQQTAIPPKKLLEQQQQQQQKQRCSGSKK
jgi:hypothetical protein